jgi:5-methylcytosine-specific restriction endonuclease McrA
MCRSHYFKAQMSGDPRIVREGSSHCSSPGCSRVFFARGFCAKHYQNELFNERLAPAYDVEHVKCSREGCETRSRFKTLCQKHHYEENKELESERNKERYYRDVEKTRAQGRAINEKYRKTEGYKLRLAKYYTENKEQYRKHARTRRARVRFVETEPYTTEDVLALYGSDCFVCGEQIDLTASRGIGAPGWQRGLHLDHHVPISKGGSDTLSNMRPTHGLCNLSKHNRLPDS